MFGNKIILWILGGILLAGAVWYSFLRDKTPAPLLTSESLTTASASDGDVVKTLLQLRAVSLSGTIFTDPAFITLKDFGSQVVPEPVGRTNPFAPLSGAVSAGTSSPKSSGQRR